MRQFATLRSIERGVDRASIDRVARTDPAKLTACVGANEDRRGGCSALEYGLGISAPGNAHQFHPTAFLADSNCVGGSAIEAAKFPRPIIPILSGSALGPREGRSSIRRKRRVSLTG